MGDFFRELSEIWQSGDALIFQMPYGRHAFAYYGLGEPNSANAYRNSDGGVVELTMTDMLLRLPDMSFDPYHCPERRWGASGGEFASCDDDPLKTRWYEAEAPLRAVGRQGQLNWTVHLDLLPVVRGDGYSVAECAGATPGIFQV